MIGSSLGLKEVAGAWLGFWSRENRAILEFCLLADFQQPILKETQINCKQSKLVKPKKAEDS